MGGDNVGKGSFGCVACTSMMALIFYAVGLSMPVWSGYWVNDRKCERDDGCLRVKKGKDVSEAYCKFKTHGIYISEMWGPTKPGLEYKKKQTEKAKTSPEKLEKTCVEHLKDQANQILKEDKNDYPECSYDKDSMVCACPYYSKDDAWKIVDSFKGNWTKEGYCKDMKKDYDDIKVEDTTVVDMMKGGWANVHLAAATLIVACCCHFIAMIMGYLGLVTGHFAMGIVAACLNIIAIACGITGVVTGTAGTYLAMTAPYCGSWKWYKKANSSIPQPDDQVHPMGVGVIMVIIGVVFSVISSCSACGSVAAAKRAAAQKSADESNYNKF